MNERLVARIVIGLSVLLIISEIVVITLYGIRFELVFLPFVVFLASLGVLFGVVLLKGRRPEIESVSARRARAMKDEKVRRLLDGYEVDEEFLPGRRNKKKKTQREQHVAAPAGTESFSRPVMPENRRDPFENLDPQLQKLAESFGGYEQMFYKIDAMDAVAFKRLQYALDMQGIDKNQFLEPVRQALVEAAGGNSGLRERLDHEEMEEYMEQIMTGKRPQNEGNNGSCSLDIMMDDFTGMAPPTSDEFSHKPGDVINRFKNALNRK